MRSNYKRLGDYIREVNIRNRDFKTTQLYGINIDKFFMPSVANIVGTDMSNYKVVEDAQFACNRMHVGRDYRLPVALSKSASNFIVSPAYDVFEVKDTSILMPEYLMMWFSRKEYDRNAWFYTDADVRGGLNWKAFCDMTLPIPKPDKQKELVTEYESIVKRISHNSKFIKTLEDTAQSLYKQWFLDFEFPDQSNKPYKSNGGEMEYNDELKTDIPLGWKAGRLSDLAALSNKKIPLSRLTKNNYISTENMLQNRGGIREIDELPDATNVTKFHKGEILISNIRPYFKKIWLSTFDGGCSNDILCFTTLNNVAPEYLYFVLERDEFFDYVMSGSNGAKMPRGDKDWIMIFPLTLPDDLILKKFNDILIPILELINLKREEFSQLNNLLNITLSKLSTIDN
jgi:type I restriction enzyme S subunit